MSTINLFNRWQIKKTWFWLGITAGGILFIFLFFMLSVFGNIGLGSRWIISSPDLDYDYGYDGAGDAAYALGDDSVEFESAREAPAGELSVTTLNSNIIPAQAAERLIIKTGNISMEVDDTVKTRDRINNLVDTLADQGAFVVNSNESAGPTGQSPYINMVIRVPAAEFDAAMNNLAEMAEEIRDRNESSDDVTEEFVDLQNRIEALETSRDRLLGIMENADTTEDLLRAENELTRREAELNSLKGRRKYLADSSRLSRITISLTPYLPAQEIDTGWNPAKTVRRAIDNLIESVQDFADFLISFSIAVLPWLVFFGLIINGAVRISRARKAKKEEKSK